MLLFGHTSKHADEVAHKHVDVFFIFGASYELQTGNDGEFANAGLTL